LTPVGPVSHNRIQRRDNGSGESGNGASVSDSPFRFRNCLRVRAGPPSRRAITVKVKACLSWEDRWDKFRGSGNQPRQRAGSIQGEDFVKLLSFGPCRHSGCPDDANSKSTSQVSQTDFLCFDASANEIMAFWSHYKISSHICTSLSERRAWHVVFARYDYLPSKLIAVLLPPSSQRLLC
jgi:hypothetical protein